MSTGGGITSGPGGAGGAASAGGAGQVQASDGAGAFQAPANVLAGASFISIGATPATANALRLANALYVSARNAANSANAKLIGADSGDICQVGDVAQSVAVSCNATTYCYLNAPGTYVSTGAAHASVGDFRYNNVSTSYFRNAANSADVAMLASDASDQIWIGSSSAGATVAAAVKILNSRLIVAPTLTTSANGIAIGSGTFASAGEIRAVYNAFNINVRNGGNTADVNVIGVVNTGVYVGSTTADIVALRSVSSGAIYQQCGGNGFIVETGFTRNGAALIGNTDYNSPYATHGGTTLAVTASPTTPAAAVYAYEFCSFTGTFGAATVTYPLPATNTKSYTKFLVNLTNGTLTIGNGGGATVALTATVANAAEIYFDTAGAHLRAAVLTYA